MFVLPHRRWLESGGTVNSSGGSIVGEINGRVLSRT
jgi:hypothetical protein